MNTKGIFMSNTDNWETPQYLFDELDREFHFTLDPCADDCNHKCDRYFTKKDDGLSKSWRGEVCFVNPPYGREVHKWVRKAKDEYEGGATVVMLLPARTDTRWFHDYIYGMAEIRFIKGRVQFGESNQNAPFPSMIVVYRDEVFR